MIRQAAAVVLAAGLVSAAIAADPSGPTAAAVKAAQAEAKTGATARLGPVLSALYKSQASSSSASAPRTLSATKQVGRLQRLLHATDGTVRVDIALNGPASGARAAFESYGLKDVSIYGNHLSGRAPIAALSAIARNTSVVTVRPAIYTTRAGLTTTQGDRAQRTDAVRQQFNLTGRGIKIGVLSDSVNCRLTPLTDDPEAKFTTYAEDLANGDLTKVQVLKELPEPDCSEGGTDEGRAILQLIHDVAPDAQLMFYTAGVDPTDFAVGITQLADAGAQIIVDDILYLDEPMFQDGVVAQAVDAVKARGVTYFSAAGNEERQSYEAAFKPSPDRGILGQRHNFGTYRNPDSLQLATVDPLAFSFLSLQWDEPAASASPGRGSRSDIELIFYDTQNEPIMPCDDNLLPPVCQLTGIALNEGADPIEVAAISNATDSSIEVNVSIELFNGPPPRRVKHVWFDFDVGLFHLNEFVTDSSTAYGHPNAAGAEAVGAAAWYNTQAWGSPLWGDACKPACAEFFSSAGGVPILFDRGGHRFAVPVLRLKPGITAPDGGNTSFFFARTTDPKVGGGEPDPYPNFFGTSAAAPEAAALAALMLEQMKRNNRGHGLHLSAKRVPDFIFTTLRATAADIKKRAGRTLAPYAIERPDGFDFDSGFGMIDAVKALTVVRASQVAID